jgi:hypothetical protein
MRPLGALARGNPLCCTACSAPAFLAAKAKVILSLAGACSLRMRADSIRACNSHPNAALYPAPPQKVHDLHANGEQFDKKTELSFKYLQVGSKFVLSSPAGVGLLHRCAAMVWLPAQPICRTLLGPSLQQLAPMGKKQLSHSCPPTPAGLHRHVQQLCPRLQRRGQRHWVSCQRPTMRSCSACFGGSE